MRALLFLLALAITSAAVVDQGSQLQFDIVATCATWNNCCAGFVLRPDASSVNCLSGGCTISQCCMPTCAAPSFRCNAGTSLISNPTSVVCNTPASIGTSLAYTGYTCLQSKCCSGGSPTCASYGNCPAGFTKKASSTVCSNTPCRQEDCCLQATTTCFQTGNPVQECTNGRVRAASFSCTNSGCNQDICCDETCGSANLVSLCGNRPVNFATSGHRCSNQVGSGNNCLPDECCLQTCASDANLRCPAGKVLRPNPEGTTCASSTCSSGECCVDGGRPQCSADYLCNHNPGDVNKVLPAYCAASPCQYSECCCSFCNYCGKHFSGTCPTGTRLQLDVDCGKGSVCTSDLCCIGSCLNYPCPDGPSDPALAYAQCANPKQCTQEECCQRFGD